MPVTTDQFEEDQLNKKTNRQMRKSNKRINWKMINKTKESIGRYVIKQTEESTKRESIKQKKNQLKRGIKANNQTNKHMNQWREEQ